MNINLLAIGPIIDSFVYSPIKYFFRAFNVPDTVLGIVDTEINQHKSLFS